MLVLRGVRMLIMRRLFLIIFRGIQSHRPSLDNSSGVLNGPLLFLEWFTLDEISPFEFSELCSSAVITLHQFFGGLEHFWRGGKEARMSQPLFERKALVSRRKSYEKSRLFEFRIFRTCPQHVLSATIFKNWCKFYFESYMWTIRFPKSHFYSSEQNHRRKFPQGLKILDLDWSTWAFVRETWWRRNSIVGI